MDVIPYEVPWNGTTAICIIIHDEPWFHIDSIESTALTRFDSLSQFIEQVPDSCKIKLHASAFCPSNRSREWFITIDGIIHALRPKSPIGIDIHVRLINLFDTYLVSNPASPNSYVLDSVLEDGIARSDPNKRNKAHVVYRVFSCNEKLLYVGLSWSAAARLSQHKHNSLWFTEAKTITLEWFTTYAKAKLAETQAIKTENPMYNKAEVEL